MSKKIFIAQSVEELKFILHKVHEPIYCLPLNLETQLYCIKNKINFYNPLNFINNNFYEEALLESENLINNLDFGDLKFESHKKEYKAFIRFRFYSIAFLMELIEKINIQHKIEEIYLSGWNNYVDQYSNKNYFVTDIILNTVKNIKISQLSYSNKNQIFLQEEKKYNFYHKNLNKKKKYALVSNTGYNFLRLIFLLINKKYNILVPIFEKKNFLKKILLKIFKIYYIEFFTLPSKEKKIFTLPKIKFFYKGKDLSKILNSRKEQELANLIKLQYQSEAIDSLFAESNIKLVLTNVTRGIHGYYLDKAKKEKITSICIPHGTLSAYFNKYDKIYKNIIAEPISSSESNFFAVQSKITKKFVKLNNIKSTPIDTGNLIFCESEKNNKNIILFAVTLKDFYNFQYLGVEMYYEFLDNLSLLNKIAKNFKLNFLIKLHPSISKNIEDLKSQYKYLYFTNKKISKVLKSIFVTISFSSTVIEDSLYSHTPVILLDRWKRYKHCEAEEDVTRKNASVYYVNNEKDLLDCINTVKKSDNISFDDYIFSGRSKKNIDTLISKIL